MKTYLIGIDCELCGCKEEFLVNTKDAAEAEIAAQHTAYEQLGYLGWDEAKDEHEDWDDMEDDAQHEAAAVKEEELNIEGWVIREATQEDLDMGYAWQ